MLNGPTNFPHYSFINSAWYTHCNGSSCVPRKRVNGVCYQRRTSTRTNNTVPVIALPFMLFPKHWPPTKYKSSLWCITNERRQTMRYIVPASIINRKERLDYLLIFSANSLYDSVPSIKLLGTKRLLVYKSLSFFRSNKNKVECITPCNVAMVKIIQLCVCVCVCARWPLEYKYIIA